MNQDFNTLELARIYESQGYYQDAFKIYKHLSKTDNGNDVKSGLNRMEKKRFTNGNFSGLEFKVSGLLKDYFSLIGLESKFDTVNRTQIVTIQNRLNDRPRKILKYSTPNEIFFKEFSRKKVA